jgi:hypothetical protein
MAREDLFVANGRRVGGGLVDKKDMLGTDESRWDLSECSG